MVAESVMSAPGLYLSSGTRLRQRRERDHPDRWAAEADQRAAGARDLAAPVVKVAPALLGLRSHLKQGWVAELIVEVRLDRDRPVAAAAVWAAAAADRQLVALDVEEQVCHRERLARAAVREHGDNPLARHLD